MRSETALLIVMDKVVEPQRVKRLLREADGYLDLQMPRQALAALERIDTPGPLPFETSFLKGMIHRSLDEHAEALEAFSRAYQLKPDDLNLLLGMAWCFKRVDKVSRSIAVLEQAYKAHPKEAIILYNLACYYSLEGNKNQALSWLGRALRMDGSYRDLIPEETDFDSLRDDPDFQFVAGARDTTEETDE